MKKRQVGVKLFVDDERGAPDGWTIARTFEEAMAILATGRVTHLSLDNDMGLEQEEGHVILTYLERAMHQVGFMPPKNIKIHSANPAARKQMELAVEAIERGAAKLTGGTDGKS